MIIDVSFRITGRSVPANHGYELYAALSRLQPHFHQAEWLAVHSLNGIPARGNLLHLTERSHLRLRLPHDKLPDVMALSGKSLAIVNGTRSNTVRIGVPEIYALEAASVLYSRFVTIKVSEIEKTQRPIDREMFLVAAREQMKERGVSGEVVVDDTKDERGREVSRRVLNIKNRLIVGYAVTVRNLSDEDSLKLQEVCLGGRQRMGCGIFIPARREYQNKER